MHKIFSKKLFVFNPLVGKNISYNIHSCLYFLVWLKFYCTDDCQAMLTIKNHLYNFLYASKGSDLKYYVHIKPSTCTIILRFIFLLLTVGIQAVNADCNIIKYHHGQY